MNIIPKPELQCISARFFSPVAHHTDGFCSAIPNFEWYFVFENTWAYGLIDVLALDHIVRLVDSFASRAKVISKFNERKITSCFLESVCTIYEGNHQELRHFQMNFIRNAHIYLCHLLANVLVPSIRFEVFEGGAFRWKHLSF